MHGQKGSLINFMKHRYLLYSFLLYFMKGGVPSSTTRLRPNFRLRITSVPMPADKYSTQQNLRILAFTALFRLASRRSVSRHSDEVHHHLKCPCRLRGGARIGHSAAVAGRRPRAAARNRRAQALQQPHLSTLPLSIPRHPPVFTSCFAHIFLHYRLHEPPKRPPHIRPPPHSRSPPAHPSRLLPGLPPAGPGPRGPPGILPPPTPPRHHPGLGGLRPGRERLGRVGGPGLRPGGLAGRPGAGGPALGGGGVPARAVPAPRAPAPTHPCAETLDARARARSALFSTHARFGRLPAHRVCITTPGVGW